ncbi:MAG: hypothetical protein JSV33_05740 [bacterium]|nr:MAG: hypothetical protein JSV33_05740 [bacterium]
MKKKSLFVFCLLSVTIISSCDGGRVSRPTIKIEYGPTETLITRYRTDGSSYTSPFAPDIAGKKKVHLVVTFRRPGELVSVLLTYWQAGARSTEETIERVYNQTFQPPTGGQSIPVGIEIPGSENLGLCDGMYHMWTVNYKKEDGEPAVYIGQPQSILVTKKLLSSGQIQQATCPEQPGPGE